MLATHKMIDALEFVFLYFLLLLYFI